MNSDIEPQEIEPSEFDDELSDEALDRETGAEARLSVGGTIK